LTPPFRRGRHLSAALTALVASGNDLGEATSEALSTWTAAWTPAFAPAWATSFPIACSGPSPMMKTAMKTNPLDETQAIEGFVMPPHDTKH
jgi:hydroxymethylpyrimidine/phosphomethylpyrimidine kinase